jgi:hypothetical protein
MYMQKMEQNFKARMINHNFFENKKHISLVGEPLAKRCSADFFAYIIPGPSKHEILLLLLLFIDSP